MSEASHAGPRRDQFPLHQEPGCPPPAAATRFASLIAENAEPLLLFRELAKRRGLFGRPNRDISVSTLHRWATRGVRGIVLEWVWVAGGRGSSEDAVRRFYERLSGSAQAPPQSRGERRLRRAEAASRQMRRVLGLTGPDTRHGSRP